ncbi:MAG TPA: HD domain-containing phosphohydrolase [Solirubrobacteraceae bacterium]|nr:HD domain-containing phosphohydrolase [Solirubrobacteraceae bacterium]
MNSSKLTRYLFWAGEILLLACTAAAAGWLSRGEEWNPLLLGALLVVLAFSGEWFSVELSDGQLSASLVAIVLAMALLGPTPAAACGVAAMVMTSAKRRLPPWEWLTNLSAFAAVPFAGGLTVRALAGNVHSPSNHQMMQGITFGLIVFGVFLVALAVNFVLIGLDTRIMEGRTFSRQLREFLPLLPGQIAAGALAAILAVAYTNLGLPALFASVVVLIIFQHLTVALVRSEDRAEQLEARSRQLVGLQLGVLRTLVRALSMRDKTTGHHAAAVACYAKALAVELGCSEEEQEVIHAAGLLHEIGKFTWPDRVLHADVVKDEDLGIVRNHPHEGAILVGALDGYGPTADAILYHHERVDGRGYPAGLIGKEIPLASRILAIGCTYHTMTQGQGYRSPMSPQEAIEELRGAARHGQLDADMVESFIAVLEREGPTFAEDADFETELAFDRRVRQMAEPSLENRGTAMRMRSPRTPASRQD